MLYLFYSSLIIEEKTRQADAKMDRWYQGLVKQISGRVFKVGEGQATTETAGARNDLRPSVMRKEGSKQAIMAAPCNTAGHYIFVLWFLLLSSFFLSTFFLAYSQSSQIGCLPYFHTWWGLSANSGCRSEMCCTRLAENTGRKKSPSAHYRTTLSGYSFATKARINNRIVKQQYLLHMFSQYPERRPTNGWDQFTSLGHPSEFQRVSRLGSVIARHSSSGRQPNFAALNRGRHLYSAGNALSDHIPLRPIYIYISLFVCKHSTNTYIHKILQLLIREGKKSNTRERKRRKKGKKLKHYKTASQISKMSNQVW